ncbi:hypothetical protein VL15_14860 [Burkholderia cepacia]|uniref:Trimeric autotransporter adhesin YadA-like C-terminal membrane anchor domain-containing protein n=1 Tax=Burkholderia cepacia TaxID=292 RepID=A0A0J5X1U1_BURCE|nr:hypothetical protein VL15_14860 [Burkholderia cepacia]
MPILQPGSEMIDVSGAGGTRTLASLKDAVLSHISTSASVVTGKQLNATNTALGVLQASAVQYDNADKNSVTFNSGSNAVQLRNVAAGTAPTDAANAQQVSDALASANRYTDSSVHSLSNALNQRLDDTNRSINQLAKSAYAGIAAAMAMPNLTPSGPGRTIVAAGGATYKGGNAVAAGVTYRSRDNKWLMNSAVSVTSTGDAGVRAQVGCEF